MADEKRLSSSPRMLPLLARAGAAMIPGATRLPFLGGGGGDIPDLSLALEDVSIDRDRLASYCRVCGFPLSDTAPVTYPHILVFPLHLQLMTDRSFPFPAIGLVHIHNQITQHRPIRLVDVLSVKVWATPLEPHPRGQQFSLRSEARVGDELVWEEVSTNLRRGGGDSAGGEGRDREVPSSEELQTSATWELPGDLGRRYGAVSGDLNPIHVHSLSARLFGFPSAIAHGMWTKARCLAALQSRLPERFTVEAAFRKPIVLPAKVAFAEQETPGIIQFGVRDAEKSTPHLDGALNSG
jgi:acyl dehydratase